MFCPGFQIRYGVFDSSAAMPRLTVSPPRKVRWFELELFTEDLPGVTCIDGDAYPLRKGLFICSKPGQERHSRLPLRCHYLHVRTEDESLAALLRSLPDSCLLADAAEVERLFRTLAAIPDPRTPEQLLLLQSTAARLLSEVCRTTRQARQTEDPVSLSHRSVLQEMERYIRTHLSEDLSLEQLARRASFSPAHFHRIFTAYFGKPPHEYVLEQRIDAARSALQSEFCSLSELAAACGFSSHSHFSSRFKKVIGMTPPQYRRAMLSRLEV